MDRWINYRIFEVNENLDRNTYMLRKLISSKKKRTHCGWLLPLLRCRIHTNAILEMKYFTEILSQNRLPLECD